MTVPASVLVEVTDTVIEIAEEGITLEMATGLVARATHLRTVPISTTAPAAGQVLVYDGSQATWTDIATQVELDALTASLAAHVADVANPHAVTAAQVGAYTTVQTDAAIAAHATRTDNPHAVTKAQVGLSNVENTALSTWAGSANITTVGTLVAGAVPASLVTAGTFPGNEYVIGTTGVRTSVTDFSGGVANGALLTRGLTKVHSVDGSTNYSAQFGGIVAQVRGISNSAAGCSYTMARTRSPTEGTYSALVNNDHIGSFIWIAADGTDLATNVVRLRSEVAGSVTTSRVPGRFLIQVSAGVTDDDIATRVTITASDMTLASGVKLVTAASTTAGAGLLVPHGTAPTSPVDGAFWTTTAGAFLRINGVTKSVNLT